MNSLGGEWKTTLTVGQPLDLGTRFFQPLDYRRRPVPVAVRRMAGGHARRYSTRSRAGHVPGLARGVVGMDLGYDFGTWGELRVGYTRAFGKGRRKVGDPDVSERRLGRGGTHGEDARRPARQRQPAALRLLRRRGLLRRSDGASARRFRTTNSSAERFGVQTIGRWTGLAKFEGGTGLGTQIPFYDEYRLGGPFRLSGRPIGQLYGNTYALGSAAALLPSRATPAAPSSRTCRWASRPRPATRGRPGPGVLVGHEDRRQRLRRRRHAHRPVLHRLGALEQQVQLGVSVPEPIVLISDGDNLISFDHIS